MRYAVADVARIFQVEKKLVKDWTYYFSDYLNPLDSPPKGTERVFLIDDIRVLAYVSIIGKKTLILNISKWD